MENKMPLIGDKAPQFHAMTTKGKINFPDDYKGKWVVLFSHPADFTPVCTTEFMAFALRADEFKQLDCELVGLSIDSVHSHLAWAKSIESIEWNGHKNIKVPFPIIADISMEVANKYGMLQAVAKTQTIRAVFIIDPEGIIRTILFYPMTAGRNMDEILRVIKSLQLYDSEGYATPADWVPGGDVLLGAPLTLKDAEERIKNDDTICPLDWYLTVKKVK